MAFFNHVIEADISANTYPEPILVKQGDSGRAIIIYPTSGGEPWTIPEGATAVVHILNPMHQSATYEAEITENEGRQCILFRISAEALLEAGRASMDATVTVNGVTVSTLNFMLDIEPAPASDFPIPTPGGGVTREELDAALRQNSAVDQAFASASAQAVADSTAERLAEIREDAHILNRPRIVFMDDDGGAQAYSVLYPWMQQHGVPYSFAISSGDVSASDRFATWAQLQEMQTSPLVSWVCHSVGDDSMADYTAEQMAERYAQWRRDMASHGLKSDARAVAYNRGTSVQSTIDAVVSKFFRAGFTVTKGINAAPLDWFHLKRVGLFPSDGSYTLAQAKAQVDALADAETGFVCFFTHCYYPTFDLDGLTELVGYIRSKGIEISGVEDVIELYESMSGCECGEWTELPGNAETSRQLAKATSSAPGLPTTASTANAVLSVPLAPYPTVRTIRASGTAYSLYGMISFVDVEGRLIGCKWQEDSKSGANAQFRDVEMSVPYGANAVLVAGNSGQLMPSVKAVVSGGITGGITAEEARNIADEKIAANVPSWAREETKPTYTASDVGAIPATDYAVYSDTKAGTAKKALPVSLQHAAVLFGLSKAAGVDLAGRTDVGIGNYPADAKAAIAQMLGVPTESRFSESILETKQFATDLVSAAIADVSAIAAEVLATQADTMTVQREILEVL